MNKMELYDHFFYLIEMIFFLYINKLLYIIIYYYKFYIYIFECY